MSLIHNERTKLLATALNNTAVATLVTAVIGPSVGILNGTMVTASPLGWALLGGLWLLAGIGLHFSAHVVLGRLHS